MALQPITYDNFSGGFSDSLDNGNRTQGEIVDNFYITTENKLCQRPGSIVKNTIATDGYSPSDLLSWEPRTSGDPLLFGVHLDKLYYLLSGGTISEIKGPTNGVAFPGVLTDYGYTCHAEWHRHRYMLHADVGVSPTVYVPLMKLFYDDALARYVVCNAGLPYVGTATGATNPTITGTTYYISIVLNSFINKFNAHIDSVGSGQAHKAHGTHAQTDLDLIKYADKVLNAYNIHAQDADKTTPTVHWRAAGSSLVSSYTITTSAESGTVSPLADVVAAINDVKQLYASHWSDAALHDYVSSGSFGDTSADIVFGNYIYGFAFGYTYTVNGVTHEVIGPISLRRVENTCEPKTGDSNYAINITGIPVISGSNYDTTKVKRYIYRTTANGTVLYKLAERNNVLTTYSDTTSDAELISGALAYTTGNVLDNEPPPGGATFTILNGFGYIGGIETNPRRLVQSKGGNIGAWPSRFYLDFDSDIKTIGAAGDQLVVVCEDGTYRVEGTFDDLGRGGMQKRRISDVGGVAAKAGFSYDKKFIFCGKDQFYVTDGYSVVEISRHIKPTYARCVASSYQKSAIRAEVDVKSRLGYFTMEDTGGYLAKCNNILVLDLKNPLTSESPFTKYTNGAYFKPSSICIHEGCLYRGEVPGVVFRHQSATKTDPKIDRITGSALDTVHIPYKFRSLPEHYGTKAVRKWGSLAVLAFKNNGNLSVQPKIMKDKNSSTLKSMAPIRFRSEYTGLIMEKRHTPSGNIRAMYQQIQLEPAFLILAASDDGLTKAAYSLVGGKHLLILSSVKYDGTPSTYTWPASCEDWYVSFETDSYVSQVLVTDRVSGNTLELASNPGFGGTALKWQLKGNPKDELIEVEAITLYAKPISPSQHAPSGDSGGNA